MLRAEGAVQLNGWTASDERFYLGTAGQCRVRLWNCAPKRIRKSSVSNHHFHLEPAVAVILVSCFTKKGQHWAYNSPYTDQRFYGSTWANDRPALSQQNDLVSGLRTLPRPSFIRHYSSSIASHSCGLWSKRFASIKCGYSPPPPSPLAHFLRSPQFAGGQNSKTQRIPAFCRRETLASQASIHAAIIATSLPVQFGAKPSFPGPHAIPLPVQTKDETNQLPWQWHVNRKSRGPLTFGAVGHGASRQAVQSINDEVPAVRDFHRKLPHAADTLGRAAPRNTRGSARDLAKRGRSLQPNLSLRSARASGGTWRHHFRRLSVELESVPALLQIFVAEWSVGFVQNVVNTPWGVCQDCVASRLALRPLWKIPRFRRDWEMPSVGHD